jgi:hypothetical protein
LVALQQGLPAGARPSGKRRWSGPGPVEEADEVDELVREDASDGEEADELDPTNFITTAVLNLYFATKP